MQFFYFSKRECRMLFYFSINATMFPWVASCMEYLIFVFVAGHIFFWVKSRIIYLFAFLVFPLWWMRVGGSYSHTHYSHHFSYIVPLYFDWFFFFFGKLFYFDWLLVLKITLWSYLLKKKKKLSEVMIYERNGTIFTLFTTATVTSD